jgi:hypothetical protein
MVVSCLVCSYILKIEAVGSSGTLLDCRWTTHHYIQEDRTLLKCKSKVVPVLN